MDYRRQDIELRQHHHKSARSHNRGVALLGVLAVVGVTSMLAYQLVSLQSVSIAHVKLTKDYGQLSLYVSGLEELFASKLLQDWLDADQRPYDNIEEDWASDEIDIEIPDVEIQIRTFDLQALFNANSLNDPDSLIASNAFKELCSSLNLPYETSPKIKDWVDDDESPESRGGEDFEYSRFDPPFRTPNQLAADISEVKAFLRLNEFETQALVDHTTVLPTNHLVININTVKEEVLKALLESIDVHESVNSLINGDRDFTDVESLIADYPFLETLSPNLAISSTFFKLEGTVIVPDFGRIDFATEFYRNPDSGDVTIYKRNYGEQHEWEDIAGY